ncbi:hypothetical protein ACFVMC_11055 [Nocardia sp. NPDC127579]|uniref:hypothetical protein n=1 Tax=Nocardia sp. NPDC127579 TaxID=3345402 RepID=UPI003628178F
MAHVDPEGYPYQALVTLMGHDLRYRAKINGSDRGPVVCALTIESESGREITAQDLRAIPVRRIAAAVAQRCSRMGIGEIREDVSFEDIPDQLKVSDLQPVEPPPPGGRRRMTDEFLMEVAQLARTAFASGELVRPTLAKHFYNSPYTVDKWLAAARERGYLNPGEISRTRK